MTEEDSNRPYKKSGQRNLAVFLVPFIVFAVFATFWPTLENGFVNWDDKAVLLENQNYRGLSQTHLTWMFSTFHAGHYHPLTWLSFAFDYMIWGMNPTGYHLTNLILHTLNAVVFFLLLQALLARNKKSNIEFIQICCAAGALLFAVHPLRVESVAWATERRDVLSGFFFLLTLLAYVKMQGFDRGNSWRTKWYFIAIGVFSLSLLSKAWGITLPVVLLVMDVYPLRRFSLKDGLALVWAVIEKLPFFILAGFFAYMGFLAQFRTAMHMVADHDLLDRLTQAAYGICFYPLKTLLPLNLSPLYLLENTFNPGEPRFILSILGAVGISIGLVMGWRRLPWALSAWVCYGIIVSPVLGLTQSGEQIAADRYTYLSCLPFAILATAGLLHFQLRSPKRMKWTVGIAVFVILLTLSNLTHRQIGIWHDTLSLWNRAIAVEPNNYVAYNNRGNAHFEAGDFDNAMADFDAAIALDPAYAKSYYNRGNVRKKLRDLPGALVDANKAIALHPAYYQAYNNRGIIKQVLDDPGGALSDFDQALALKPDYGLAYANRGALRASEGDLANALNDLNKAIELIPDYAQAYFNRGALKQTMGNTKEALRDFDKTLQLKPDYGLAYVNRGALRASEGDLPNALSDLNKAIELNPENANAYFRRGLLRREKGDVEGALADYDKAINLNPYHLDAYVKRGGLRGNLGDLEGVIADYSKAIEIAPNDWPPRVQLENYIAQARQLLKNQN